MTDEPKQDEEAKKDEDEGLYGSARVSEHLQPPPGYETLQARLKKVAKRLDLFGLEKRRR